MKEKKQIVWVDDDLYHLHRYVFALQDRGIETIAVKTTAEAKDAVLANNVALVIVDVMLPPEPGEVMSTKGGFESGLVFSKWVKDRFPNIPVVGFSHSRDAEVIGWFNRFGAAYISKFDAEETDRFVEQITHLLGGEAKTKPRIFIVHGHDEVATLELKNYIQNTLKLGEPTILKEMPSRGRTIIEKFEEYASMTDIAFVLLTPDDFGEDTNDARLVKNRARQNVLLELGYFLGRLTRKSGKVILLYKGKLDLPSDISGVIYIDISNGIQAAGELIRREIVFLG